MNLNPSAEARRLDDDHYAERHFIATVGTVGATTATVTRNGGSVAEGPYPFVKGLTLTTGDRVWVVDTTGARAWAIMAEFN